ncbi:hypothetical protein, partial [Bradyrhizobium sp. Bra64]|uniref:hypothetical protein n=1 Tax=Bradyrhizobium sp. Bra64 TaxID=2926009 RepID=UPI0021188DF5
ARPGGFALPSYTTSGDTTGPTGGGDGKTDAETYPVAKESSERWFAADQAAANERWAFAFSAKED